MTKSPSGGIGKCVGTSSNCRVESIASPCTTGRERRSHGRVLPAGLDGLRCGSRSAGVHLMSDGVLDWEVNEA